MLFYVAADKLRPLIIDSESWNAALVNISRQGYYTHQATNYFYSSPSIFGGAKSSLFYCGEMKGLQLPNYEESLEEADGCNTFHTFLHPFLREYSK